MMTTATTLQPADAAALARYTDGQIVALSMAYIQAGALVLRGPHQPEANPLHPDPEVQTRAAGLALVLRSVLDKHSRRTGRYTIVAPLDQDQAAALAELLEVGALVWDANAPPPYNLSIITDPGNRQPWCPTARALAAWGAQWGAPLDTATIAGLVGRYAGMVEQGQPLPHPPH